MSDASHEAFAIEHVANQLAVFSSPDGVTGTRDFDGGRNLIEMADHRDFMRHRDQRAMEIRESANLREGAGEIVARHAHRHDDGIDIAPLEPWIVDHWRFEGRRWIAEMSDQLGGAVDHHADTPPKQHL